MKDAIEKGLYFLIIIYIIFMLIIVVTGLIVVVSELNRDKKEYKLMIYKTQPISICDSCEFSISDYDKINDNM